MYPIGYNFRTNDRMELIVLPNDAELNNDRLELILIPNKVELNNLRMELILIPNDGGFTLVCKHVPKIFL